MDAKGLKHLCWIASLGLAWPVAAAVDEDHVLRAASGYKADSEPGTLRALGALEERRIAPYERMFRPKGGSSFGASAYVSDHWIYDAGIELFFDADNDGYYRYLRITFDVDSYFDFAWVYAAIYLSPDGEVWELLHETDDFRVDGETSADAYEVETELVSGYPPGEYDLLIELYDADTGYFQDELGPAQTSAFALLPLEDRTYDTPSTVVVVRESGGGGALSWPMMTLLAASLGVARLRRRAGRRAERSLQALSCAPAESKSRSLA